MMNAPKTTSEIVEEPPKQTTTRTETSNIYSIKEPLKSRSQRGEQTGEDDVEPGRYR